MAKELISLICHSGYYPSVPFLPFIPKHIDLNVSIGVINLLNKKTNLWKRTLLCAIGPFHEQVLTSKIFDRFLPQEQVLK